MLIDNKMFSMLALVDGLEDDVMKCFSSFGNFTMYDAISNFWHFSLQDAQKWPHLYFCLQPNLGNILGFEMPDQKLNG